MRVIVIDNSQGSLAASDPYQNPVDAQAPWLERMLAVYKHAVWLNPTTERYWSSTPSLRLIQQIMGNRMYPLTLDGIDAAISELMR